MHDSNSNPPKQFDYKTLSEYIVGALHGGIRSHIVEVADEAYRAYKVNCFRSAIILSAEVVYRLNIELLIKAARIRGEIKYRYKSKSIILKASDTLAPLNAVDKLMSDRDGISFYHSIIFLQELGIIDDLLVNDMNALRYLRNTVIHKFDYPEITWRNYRKELSDIEWANQIVSNKIPPRLRLWEMIMDIWDNIYEIDQERLNITIDDLPPNKQFAVLSLGLLLHCIKEVTNLLSKRTDQYKETYNTRDAKVGKIVLHFSNRGDLANQSEDLIAQVRQAILSSKHNPYPRFSVIFDQSPDTSDPYFQIEPGIFPNTIPSSGLEELLANRIEYVFHKNIISYLNSEDLVFECIKYIAKGFFFGAWKGIREEAKGKISFDVVHSDFGGTIYIILDLDEEDVELLRQRYKEENKLFPFRVIELSKKVISQKVIPLIILKTIKLKEGESSYDIDLMLDLTKWKIVGIH